MKCSVPDCGNYQTRFNKTHGITYHTFPRNPVMRGLWVKALGLGDWQPKSRYVVCSAHFRKDNFYINKAGWLRLKSDAIPKFKLGKDNKSSNSKLRSPNQPHLKKTTVESVCRICLCTDRLTYNLEDCNLTKYYELLTVSQVSPEDSLPKQICWECKARLTSFVRFRNIAEQSLNLLKNFYNTGKNDCEADNQIFNIDRDLNNLTSRLTAKNLKGDADYHFNEELSLSDDIKIENDDKFDTENGPSEPDIKIEVVNIDTVFEENDNQDIDDQIIEDTKFEDQNDVSVDDLKNDGKELGNNDINDFEQENYSFSSSDDDLLITTKNKKVKVNKDKQINTKKRKKDSVNEKSNWEEFFDVKILSIEEKVLSVQKRKESDNYKNSEFKCDLCFKGFAVEKTYQRHLFKHSDESGKYECDYCKFRFKKSYAMLGHRRSLHSKRYSCKLCDYVTMAPDGAILHERFHKGKKYKCPHCEMEFIKLTTYLSHVRIKHSSDFVCKLCGCSFVSDKGLSQHCNLKHHDVEKQIPEDGPFCTECNIQFINQDALNTHYQNSTKHNFNRVSKRGTVRAPIPRDGRKKGIKKNVTTGIKPEKPKLQAPINCEQCDMQLPDFRKYSYHFRECHPEKNRTLYPKHMTCMCDVCGKILPCLTYLYEHSLTHKGVKQFPCTQCGKSFVNSIRLKLHEQIHLKRSYPCDVCGKKFSTKGNVTKHMVIHMGIKFECEICGKSFKHSEHKKAHVDYVHLKKPWPKRNRVVRNKKKIQAQTETTYSLGEVSNVDNNSIPFEDTTTSV